MSSLISFFNNMSIKGREDNNNTIVPTSQKVSSEKLPPYLTTTTTAPKTCMSITRGRKRKPESCVICFQLCTSSNWMKAEGCDHAVCEACLRIYFKTILNDKRYASLEMVQCPSFKCEAYFLSQKVVQTIYTTKQRNDWWTSATTKTFVQNKVVCPFLDCKAVYDADASLTKRCTFAECYECRRGICVACQDKWHDGIIKILDDEEELKKTLSTAKASSWTQCPRCNHLVEKKYGCTTIVCICGTEFCYRCGGYSVNHSCANKCYTLPHKQVETIRNQMFARTSNLTTNKMRKIN